MAAPTTTRNKVKYRLIDTSANNPNLADATVLDEAIGRAVVRYSRDRPLMVVEDESGNGTPFYTLVGAGAVLASWSDKFSQIDCIEYPAGDVSSDYRPTFLDRQDDWQEDFRIPDKILLRFKTLSPAATETFRVTYSALHTHTSVTDTVPAADLEALCDLSAHYACIILGTEAAGVTDSLVEADTTNYRDAQLRYSQQAKAWLDSYNRHMGISPSSEAGASSAKGGSAWADWDQKYQSGFPFLTHWSRNR